jgi:hypothetical protein
MIRSLTGVLVLAATVCISLSAAAHHSFAIFDHTQTLTVRGKVASFQWTNPHGYLALDVTEGGKGAERYTLELTSINMLQRAGWKSSDVHAGDQVTAIIAPLLSGEPGGLLLELKVPDGRTLVPPVPQIGSFKRSQP